MIQAKIIYHHHDIKRVHITGHAESAEYGKDLVCAGVSTVVTGVYNTLEKHNCLTQGTFIVKRGFADFEVKKVTRENQLILETLITTLETLEYTDKSYIRLLKEEV